MHWRQDTKADSKKATLSWSCVCDNGQTPNASEYSQTIPYFECTESNNDCVANCNGDSTCQSACRYVFGLLFSLTQRRTKLIYNAYNRSNNPCGAKDPTPANSSTRSHTMTKTASNSDSSSTGSSDGSDATDTAFSTLGGGGSSQTSNAGAGSNANGDSGASQLALDMGKSWGLAVVLGSVFFGAVLML
jgi:cobalamin biosynthesis Mg chelatase CobN